jgi:hypothetical protein
MGQQWSLKNIAGVTRCTVFLMVWGYISYYGVSELVYRGQVLILLTF